MITVDDRGWLLPEGGASPAWGKVKVPLEHGVFTLERGPAFVAGRVSAPQRHKTMKMSWHHQNGVSSSHPVNALQSVVRGSPKTLADKNATHLTLLRQKLSSQIGELPPYSAPFGSERQPQLVMDVGVDSFDRPIRNRPATTSSVGKSASRATSDLGTKNLLISPVSAAATNRQRAPLATSNRPVRSSHRTTVSTRLGLPRARQDTRHDTRPNTADGESRTTHCPSTSSAAIGSRVPFLVSHRKQPPSTSNQDSGSAVAVGNNALTVPCSKAQLPQRPHTCEGGRKSLESAAAMARSKLTTTTTTMTTMNEPLVLPRPSPVHGTRGNTSRSGCSVPNNTGGSVAGGSIKKHQGPFVFRSPLNGFETASLQRNQQTNHWQRGDDASPTELQQAQEPVKQHGRSGELSNFFDLPHQNITSWVQPKPGSITALKNTSRLPNMPGWRSF
mmetsp:Transcript_73690/g.139203  ORF Transcript_73690/g.139203 Transcript_73690/m.139203 type:complete len:445 (-) Transcript_73690:257-1591(-)